MRLCFKLSVITNDQKVRKYLKVYKVKQLQLAKVNLLLKKTYFYKFSVA